MLYPKIAFILVATLCIPYAVVADSLYDQKTYRPLAADHRAFRVGDNLTVLVTEVASMTTTANTTTDKKGDVNGSITNSNGTHADGVSASEDFSGGGKIERSGKLVAQLTVVVEEVAPNGDLAVKGIQDIVVNNEKQRLSIRGRVKPQDISASNTVSSTRLSDAQISYVGDGLLAEKQDPGVLTRFLSWLGIL